jgi:tetratricopeptide (TPR) repeat protein
MVNTKRFYRGWVLVFLAFFSCGSLPVLVTETPLSIPASPPDVPLKGAPGGGVADEIRSLVEDGAPDSLMRALERIDALNLGTSDFGRVMSAISVTLIQKLYPDIDADLPSPDPPRTHPYTRILLSAAEGVYCTPPHNSQDYLELVLPFLAFLDERRGSLLREALPDLKRAAGLKPRGVLAPYFTGLIYERNLQGDEAAEAFAAAYRISPEFYPAALGFARYLNFKGEVQEEIDLLSVLVSRYPENMAIKRQLALAYYNKRDWEKAESAIAEIFQGSAGSRSAGSGSAGARFSGPGSPRDGPFILMRAHLLVEQGRCTQAQEPLDSYSLINPNDRLYLFLRARLQAEGYRNREGALSYLRSILRVSPDDEEALVYAAQLLMESTRSEDQGEGRKILQRLLSHDASGPEALPVITLAVRDAVHRQAWQDAQPYVDQLLAQRRSPQDLFFAYTVEQGLGRRDAALAYARELYETDPANEEGIIAYISALVDAGRRAEAAALLETRLAALDGSGPQGGVIKSRYYYLRSRLRTNEDAVMTDLRASLFEDPRNLDALTTLFEIYHRRKDERRAVYYLKQALALAPDNVQLKRYQEEYARAGN